MAEQLRRRYFAKAGYEKNNPTSSPCCLCRERRATVGAKNHPVTHAAGPSDSSASLVATRPRTCRSTGGRLGRVGCRAGEPPPTPAEVARQGQLPPCGLRRQGHRSEPLGLVVRAVPLGSSGV